MASIQHQYILVSMETDPGRYHGENASQPALLEHGEAEQILARIAADLTSMFPAISRCALSMAGALFDQAQVLQPRLPVYRALKTLQQSGNPDNDFHPCLLAIGASEGQMPAPELQPSAGIPPGSLQNLPLLISGPAAEIDELATEMEHCFRQKGQLSGRSAKDLGASFQVSVNHARFMTIANLNTLLRRQLEHYGFVPLWELLDAAMSPPAEMLEVRTPAGLRFRCLNGTVHSFFEPFDWWAKYGGGVDAPASNQQLQSAYAEWTLEYRRYQTMLSTHGVSVCQHLAGLEDTDLSDSFLLEESTLLPATTAAPVTEHSTDQLGIVAVTVVSGGRQMNFYPLQANGLNDLHRYIRDQGYSGDIAYPGRICYDENSRQLISESLPG